MDEAKTALDISIRALAQAELRQRAPQAVATNGHMYCQGSAAQQRQPQSSHAQRTSMHSGIAPRAPQPMQPRSPAASLSQSPHAFAPGGHAAGVSFQMGSHDQQHYQLPAVSLQPRQPPAVPQQRAQQSMAQPASEWRPAQQSMAQQSGAQVNAAQPSSEWRSAQQSVAQQSMAQPSSEWRSVSDMPQRQYSLGASQQRQSQPGLTSIASAAPAALAAPAGLATGARVSRSLSGPEAYWPPGELAGPALRQQLSRSSGSDHHSHGPYPFGAVSGATLAMPLGSGHGNSSGNLAAIAGSSPRSQARHPAAPELVPETSVPASPVADDQSSLLGVLCEAARLGLRVCLHQASLQRLHVAPNQAAAQCAGLSL